VAPPFGQLSYKTNMLAIGTSLIPSRFLYLVLRWTCKWHERSGWRKYSKTGWTLHTILFAYNRNYNI